MDSFLADLILLVHFGYVLFVVLGLAVIWAGYFLKWPFVRNFWFRLTHLLAMAYVVAESLMSVDCPLTLWENQFRLKAGGGVYQGSFVEHWVHQIMYYDGNPQTFTVIYVLFFTAMALSFWFVTPKWP
ncbi:MAG TPA: DUF2784 domain-containing protein, partial [bacterium]|nr:DUF2784 domain-containing protein [bacterium]